MHVGIIRRKYNPTGGAEKIIQRILSCLADFEDIRNVSILASEWPNADIAKGDQFGCKFKFVKIKERGGWRYQKQRNFLDDVSAAIRLNPSMNIIQSHERLPGCDIFRAGDGVHMAWLNRLQRERSAFRGFLLGMDPYHELIRKNELLMAKDPKTMFVANSPLARREIQEFLEVPDHRVVTITNSIDTSKWGSISRTEASRVEAKSLLSMNPERPCVVFVGSGFDRKGLAPLIRAVGMSTDYQLLVLGSDKSENRYKALAERVAPGRVFFAGPLTPFGPPLMAADVFCLPSLYDSFSNAALESIAAGIPVVITEDTGLADYIAREGGGVICTRQPESILWSLQYCVENSAILSTQARTLAQSFDHSLTAGMWLDLYKRIASSRANP